MPISGRWLTPTKVFVNVLMLAAFVLPAPFVILSPGDPQNILGSAITISGTKVYPTTGKLSVTSVMVTDPDSYMTGFDVLYGWVDKTRAVIPRSEVYPEGETAEQAVEEGAAEMSGSQINATAAALAYLGYKSASKIVVLDINKSSNAYKTIEVLDQLVSIDDRKVKSSSELIAYLGDKKPGDLVTIKVIRAGLGELIKQVKLSAREDDSAFIGINIEEQFDFPFDVKIKLEETGGPSGGLIFALGVVEKLTPANLVRSRNIAGTGTITTDGRVGPIGGIAEKIIGAQADGVEIFLTPTENCMDIKNLKALATEKSGKSGKVMKIVPVATLAEAISLLELPDNAKFPSCKSFT